jgi:hypothetical protein
MTTTVIPPAALPLGGRVHVHRKRSVVSRPIHDVPQDEGRLHAGDPVDHLLLGDFLHFDILLTHARGSSWAMRSGARRKVSRPDTQKPPGPHGRGGFIGRITSVRPGDYKRPMNSPQVADIHLPPTGLLDPC